MEIHTYFILLFYGFSFILKLYEFYKTREQEKKLAESLDKLGKFLNKPNELDK